MLEHILETLLLILLAQTLFAITCDLADCLHMPTLDRRHCLGTLKRAHLCAQKVEGRVSHVHSRRHWVAVRFKT